MKIAVLQLNFTIGDFKGNHDKILGGYQKAVEQSADLVVCTELALFGYPPGDTLLYKKYRDQHDRTLSELASYVKDVGLIIGIITPNKVGSGLDLHNSAALIQNGKIKQDCIQDKTLLPTYDVFVERLYFEPSRYPVVRVIQYKGKRIAILICEDIWFDIENPGGQPIYSFDPVETLIDQDIDVLITVNASPFYITKIFDRFNVAKQTINKVSCPIVYANQVGGNDELVFDGRSFVMDEGGNIVALAKGFDEDLLFFDLDNRPDPINFIYNEEQETLDALVLGTRDYINKIPGENRVRIALSGGVDSALVTTIACMAIGPENVFTYGMPMEFSLSDSVTDSKQLSKNLGFEYQVIPIQLIYNAFGDTLNPFIGWNVPGSVPGDVTEENFQARIRGTVVVGETNRNGGIALTTGNKSELSVGFCTSQGDMAGGFAVICDLFKTKIFNLCKHINSESEIIPLNIIEKPPTPDLRPGQLDSQSLPDYVSVLDPILQSYIEDSMDSHQIVKMGFDKKVVEKVISMVVAAEHKRRIMPIGLKMTKKAFGSGRRFPVAGVF